MKTEGHQPQADRQDTYNVLTVSLYYKELLIY